MLLLVTDLLTSLVCLTSSFPSCSKKNSHARNANSSYFTRGTPPTSLSPRKRRSRSQKGSLGIIKWMARKLQMIMFLVNLPLGPWTPSYLRFAVPSVDSRHLQLRLCRTKIRLKIVFSFLGIF